MKNHSNNFFNSDEIFYIAQIYIAKIFMRNTPFLFSPKVKRTVTRIVKKLKRKKKRKEKQDGTSSKKIIRVDSGW